jgi:hypothetical protein
MRGEPRRIHLADKCGRATSLPRGYPIRMLGTGPRPDRDGQPTMTYTEGLLLRCEDVEE